jgi:hypothetical protein
MTPDAAFAEILAAARPLLPMRRFAHSAVTFPPHGVGLA